LERAVNIFSDASNREEKGSGKLMLDCLVTKDDLQLAVQDVVSAESDRAEDDEPASETSDEENTEEPEVESS
jgi:hypothetical protein